MALNYLPNGEPDYRAAAPAARPLPTRAESVRALQSLGDDTTSPAAVWHAQRIEFLDAANKEPACN